MYSLYDTWGFPCVFPHSEISGSLAMCAYPKLIAAYHVLHRLLMPRHSPCALCSLTYSVKNFQSFAFNITKNISWLTSQYILKLYYIIHMQFSKNKLVGLNGLEPSTSRLSGVRSNQLSYRPIVVEVKGVEPLTPCVQGKCSPNWAIPPQVIEQSNDRSKLNRN